MRGLLLVVTIAATAAHAQMPAQYIWHHDGDVFDRDDIASLAVNALYIDRVGLQGRATIAYNNNLAGGSDVDQIADMRASAGFAATLGIDTLDYEADEAGTTAALAAIIEAGGPVVSFEGGPMEAIYRVLAAVSYPNLQNVTLVSHSSWNENSSWDGSRTWADLQADFPTVTYVEIADQNAGFFSDLWNWLDETDVVKFQLARNAMYGAGGKVNDASDSGMTFWHLTGREDGTPLDAKVYLESAGEPCADLDGSGFVNFADLSIFKSQFGQQAGALPGCL